MHADPTQAWTKAGRRLVPFMALLFVISFIDRANVGFAALAMNRDLGFSPTLYAWGVGFFFFGYVLFELPSNLALARLGARRWMAIIVTVWGCVSVAMALVQDATSFFALRFLLGVAEAGFMPGMLLFLTYWFPAARRGRMSALFLVAIPFSNAIGAPVSGAIMALDGLNGAAGLTNWQWLFVLEGLPAIVLGLLVPKVLADGPDDAHWLSPEERRTIKDALAEDDAALAAQRRPTGLKAGLLSAPVLLLCLAYFGQLLGGFGIIFWVPQMVKGFGLSHMQTGLVAAIPYLIASAVMLVLAHIGDRGGRRVPLVIGPLLAGALGLAGAGLTTDPVLSIIALSVAASGIYGALPAFWTLPTAYLSGMAAAGAFAMVNSIGALGGFIGPYIVGWAKETTGAFSAGLLILAVGAVVSAGVIALLAHRHHRPGH